jgi:parvulin-like peptidyl-prolyl isomerase
LNFNKKLAIGIASGSAIIIVFIPLFLFMSSGMTLNETELAEPQDESNPIVAEINGQEIRLEEVQDAVNMENSQGQIIDKVTALERMIAKILLLEEAQARNVSMTMDEVEEEITSMYAQSGLSQEQFEEKLKEIGTTYDQTLKMYREELIINKMLADEISKTELQVSDEETRKVFEDNKDVIMAQMGNSTVFEDISSQLKTTLLQEKQQKVALDIIEHLRDKSVVITYEDHLK